MNQAEVIEYKGIKFRRYPTSDHWCSKYYYVPNGVWRKKGVKRLHQEIWEERFGEIPKNYVIHHKDHNPLNNDISNLECIPKTEHSEIHGEKWESFSGKKKKAIKAHLKKIREQASNWHGSKEGREWHKQHAKKVWKNREYETFVCEYCGEAFEKINNGKNRFCSNKCKSAWRRKEGLDDVTKKCLYCGKTFKINKYRKAKYCSDKCAVKNYWKNTKEKNKVKIICATCGKEFKVGKWRKDTAKYCSVECSRNRKK